MRRFRKYHVLSCIALCTMVLWFVYSYRVMTSLPQDSNGMDPSTKHEISMHVGPVDLKSVSYKNPTSVKAINLPKNFSAVDLKGWELLVEEGEESLINNEMDYMQGEISKPGLTFKDRIFYLNKMRFQIFSGAIHYFRVVPEYWMDRLKKLKACGMNTVETYVSWNLHEPSPGVYDFDGILNLRRFITMAAELGLYVILRPGPFICSEFEYGGLPGWLLADPAMKVRSNYPGYIDRVNKFFSVLMPQVLDLQFAEGGPIIMFQVENEYLTYGVDSHHLKLLLYMFRRYGVKETVATSDHDYSLMTNYPKFDISKYALPTLNLAELTGGRIDYIERLNRHFPIMVMEFWIGWFDTWKKKYHETKELNNNSLTHLLDHQGSFNIYMFHGGTNFGFTGGALNMSGYSPMTTSYDYDSPLTEAGDTTKKYFQIREQMLKFYRKLGIPFLPEVPPNLPKANYGSLKVQEIMEWQSLMSILPILLQSDSLQYMETVTDSTGRHFIFGYIIYSHLLRAGVEWNRRPGHHITGYVSGRLTAMMNGETFYIGKDNAPISEDDYLWDKKMESNVLQFLEEYTMDFDDIMREPHWLFPFTLKVKSMTSGVEKLRKTVPLQLDLMVENQGRLNFVHWEGVSTMNAQRRGLSGRVLKDVFGIKQEEWTIRMLHFDKEQTQSISKSNMWMTMKAFGRMLEDTEESQKSGPTLYRTYLNVPGAPKDTFVRLDGWTKGIVLVNGFNLGRYWNVGPQKTLYLPGPVLKQGTNEIIVFEEESRGEFITLQDTPDLGAQKFSW